MYQNKIKYPKTFHFDFSESFSREDKKIKSLESFENQRVIVTEKMDGENTNIYNNYYHPRSLTDDGHSSRNWIKGHAAQFNYKIPNGWRVCGENLFAEHSIKYNNINSYFLAFNIWNIDNFCLAWDSFLYWCEKLDIDHVPVIYDGIFNYNKIKEIYYNLDFKKQEGIVCKVSHMFHFDNFQKCVAKAVRKNHIQTEEHWKRNWNIKKINKLKKL